MSTIPNDTVGTQITDSINTAKAATGENVSNLTFFYKYSWAIALICLTLIFYMFTRQTVETEVV